MNSDEKKIALGKGLGVGQNFQWLKKLLKKYNLTRELEKKEKLVIFALLFF